MRNVIIFINICIAAGVTMLMAELKDWSSTAEEMSAVPRQAEASLVDLPDENAEDNAPVKARKPLSKSLSKKEAAYVHAFIDEMVQARILEREGGKLAAQRGTNRPLKAYGEWMVVHQQQMLDDIRKIAALHGLETASTLSNELTGELSALHKLHGKRFDSRYIKAMIAAHKRDIRRLERASYAQDPDVQVFAARYISIVKDNLQKVQQMKKGV